MVDREKSDLPFPEFPRRAQWMGAIAEVVKRSEVPSAELQKIDTQILGGVLPREVEELNRRVSSLRSKFEKLSKLPSTLLDKKVPFNKLSFHIQELLGEAGVSTDSEKEIGCTFEYDQTYGGGHFRFDWDGDEVGNYDRGLPVELGDQRGYLPGPINTIIVNFDGRQQDNNRSSILNIRPLDKLGSYVYPEWRRIGARHSELKAYEASRCAQRLQLLTAPQYMDYHLTLGETLVRLLDNSESPKRETQPYFDVRNTGEI